MPDQINKRRHRSWQEYAAKAGSFFILTATRRWVRGMIMIVVAIVFVWLVRSNVWRPLNLEVRLPVSISKEDPGLSIRTLQAINTLRAERIKRQRPDYSAFSRVFVTPPKNE